MAYRICLWMALAGTALASPPVSAVRPQAPVPVCLHTAGERDGDRIRREHALALAKAINQAQGTVAERTRNYVSLAQLRNLPATPRGFDLRLYSDGAGYIVSLKDTLDPCRYAIFSDESAFIYERTPLAAPVLATGS